MRNNYKTIKVTETPSGDKIIILDRVALTRLENLLYDGGEYLANCGFEASAKDARDLWLTIVDQDRN